MLSYKTNFNRLNKVTISCARCLYINIDGSGKYYTRKMIFNFFVLIHSNVHT